MFGVVLAVFFLNNLDVSAKEVPRIQRVWTGCIFFLVNLLLLYSVSYAGYWMIL
jgi:hypothetical protein